MRKDAVGAVAGEVGFVRLFLGMALGGGEDAVVWRSPEE